MPSIHLIGGALETIFHCVGLADDEGTSSLIDNLLPVIRMYGGYPPCDPQLFKTHAAIFVAAMIVVIG